MQAKILVLVASLAFSTTISAATCRSQTAADAGSQAGYARDKAAAEEVEKKVSQSSIILGKCVSGISTVTVAPAFPSLAEIFAKVVEKVCKVPIDQIRAAIPSGLLENPAPGIPPMPAWPGSPEANGSPIALSAVRSSAAPNTGNNASASTKKALPSDFWKKIWH
ncbi:MAG: hypothetical protein V4724_39520 [Pseudomonadota bacterium]